MNSTLIFLLSSWNMQLWFFLTGPEALGSVALLMWNEGISTLCLKIGATSTSIFSNGKKSALSIHAWKLLLVRASMFFSCKSCQWEKENLVMCIWCVSLGWLVSRSSKLCQSTNVGEYATNHSRVPFSIYNYHQSSSNLSKKSLQVESMEDLILVSHKFTCHLRYGKIFNFWNDNE